MDPERELANKILLLAIAEAKKSPERFRVGVVVGNKDGHPIATAHNEVMPEFASFYKAQRRNVAKLVQYAMINLSVEKALSEVGPFQIPFYVCSTCVPSPYCIKEIVKRKIKHVIYFDQRRQSYNKNLENRAQRTSEQEHIVMCSKLMLKDLQDNGILQYRELGLDNLYPDVREALQTLHPQRLLLENETMLQNK